MALRRRSRTEWVSAALVVGGLVGFVVLTYLVVVVGGGLALGHGSSPHVGLSVVATAVVALAFDPVLTRLEGVAEGLVGARKTSPYDALRRFSGAVAANGPAEGLPQRMARVLAEGTNAEWAQVWVSVAGRHVPAATWPPEAEARLMRTQDWDPGTRQLSVRHGNEELGLLVLHERTPLTPVEERLFAGLAAQAGLVLRGAQLRAALEQRLSELSLREAELRESRERLVDAQDAARRRLERDIHDGAQQHLVALAVNLRLAATLAGSAPERADALLSAQEVAAADAMATLVQLARGIYPPLLEHEGVAAALRAEVAEGLVEVVAVGDGRYPLVVEAAAYFCGLEAIQNATKHAGTVTVRVQVEARPEGLTLAVTDEGSGFDPAQVTIGTGLANIRDRADAVGGTVELSSSPGQGTRLEVGFPVPVVSRSAVGG
jgi:signal transduction histidine kinase